MNGEEKISWQEEAEVAVNVPQVHTWDSASINLRPVHAEDLATIADLVEALEVSDSHFHHRKATGIHCCIYHVSK